MIDALTYMIVILAIFQRSWHRMQIVSIFAAMTLIHNSFMHHLDGLAYYGSDALFYAIIISATAALPKVSDLTISIHKICLAAIVLDAFGWVIWMLYLPPDSYNVAFMVLYAWTIITIISGDKEDAGIFKLGWRGDPFRSRLNPSGPIYHRNEKEKWVTK